MVNYKLLRGVFPPMVTLFNDAVKIDWAANKKLVNYLIGQQVSGIFILGSLGEFCHLSIKERKEYTEFIINEIENQVPVLVGVGHTSTKLTIELGQHAEQIGADYLVAVTPYYWGLDKRAISSHYRRLAESTNLPILIYNFPQLTGINLAVETVKQIALNNENIVGIKDTIDSLTHLHNLINQVKAVKENFSVLAGLDQYLLSNLIAGGDGMIGGSANFYPQLGLDIFKAYEADDFKTAIKLQNKLNQISKIYDLSTPPLALIKEAINLRTDLNISTVVRKPGNTVDLFNKQKLSHILDKVD